MKVLMTADCVGGVWTYSLTLARALAEHGTTVCLAVMGRELTTDQREQLRHLPNLDVRESRYKLEWMEDPWTDLHRAGEWLIGLDREIQPDVVHLNNYAPGTLPWSAPVLCVGHSCVCTWWRAVKGARAPAQWNRYHRLVRDGLQSADMIVTPTVAMLRELFREYGPFRRGTAIANGVDPRDFRLRPKQNMILAAGRLWDSAKNLEAMLAVAGDMPCAVRIAGETSGEQALQGVAPNVTLSGRLSQRDLAAAMGEAAIFCHPARYEPFGLAPLEAGLSGCALVLGRIDSLREVWEDSAMYVNPEDHDELRRTLGLLAGDPALCRRMGAKARKRAARYSAQRMGFAYNALYRRLVAERESHPAIRKTA